MNKEEFMDYVRENFEIDGTSQRLMDNILDYVETQNLSKKEQHKVLYKLLDGTIGLEKKEIRRIIL